MKEYSLFAISVATPILFAGCAQVIPTPTDQAAQIDFGSVYIRQMSLKYQTKDLSNGGRCIGMDGKEVASLGAEKKFGTAQDGTCDRFQKMLEDYDKYAGLDLDLKTKESDRIAISGLQEEIRFLQGRISKVTGQINELRTQATRESALIIAREGKKGASGGKGTKPAGSPSPIIDSQRFAISAYASEIAILEVQRNSDQSRIKELDKSISDLTSKKYDTSERKRKDIRNEIILDFLSIADYNYLEFKNALLGGRARTDTIADVGELLLSTATTLTGGVTAKTNLGAASTLLKGGRSTVDKNFFAQQTMRAIINAMEEGRAQDRKVIVDQMQKSAQDYSLSEAISDVQRYQSRSSVFVAVLDLANQSGKSADVAKGKLVTAEKGIFRSDSPPEKKNP